MAEQITVTIPRGHKSELDAKLEIEPEIKAPIALGDTLGRLLVELDGEVIVDQKIVALADVDEGGIFKRLLDWIKLFFIGLFS